VSLKTFFILVEIKTKIASLFPFLIGSLYVYYRYDTFRPMNTLIFFFSMLIFDLTTTAINNYMDYKKASTDEYRKTVNIIGRANIPEKLVVTTILTMLTIATSLGIWLVFRTDLLVLLIGMVCFGIGIFYTFGPIPLSRMPLGEIFSGLTMGFGILFLTVYINAFDQGIANILWEGSAIQIYVDIIKLLEILLVSVPCIFTIANIMLANNICDLEDDIKNNRFTLTYYIGKRNSVLLFNILYILSFVAIVIAVLLKLLPTIMLLTLATIIPVYKQLAIFNNKQVKSETFDVSLKNFIIVNGSFFITLALSVILM